MSILVSIRWIPMLVLVSIQSFSMLVLASMQLISMSILVSVQSSMSIRVSIQLPSISKCFLNADSGLYTVTFHVDSSLHTIIFSMLVLVTMQLLSMSIRVDFGFPPAVLGAESNFWPITFNAGAGLHPHGSPWLYPVPSQVYLRCWIRSPPNGFHSRIRSPSNCFLMLNLVSIQLPSLSILVFTRLTMSSPVSNHCTIWLASGPTYFFWGWFWYPTNYFQCLTWSPTIVPASIFGPPPIILKAVSRL